MDQNGEKPPAAASEPGGEDSPPAKADGSETVDELVARLEKEAGAAGPKIPDAVSESPPAKKGPSGKAKRKARATKRLEGRPEPDAQDNIIKVEPVIAEPSGPKASGRRAADKEPINISNGSDRIGGRTNMLEGRRMGRVLGMIIGLVVVTFAILGVTLDMLEIIPAGHKGVIVTSPGGPSNEEINEGYQFSTAYIWADVEIVEYRTQTVHFVGADYSDDEKGSIQIITNDSMPIFLDLSVIYHIEEDKVADLIIENGKDYQHRIIYPYVRSISRDVASRYQALDIIGDKRSAVESTIQQTIITKMAEKSIIVEGVAMRDVRIPANLEAAIISKKVAEQTVLTEQYNLIAREYIANQTIVNAQANATAYIVEQTGFANGTVLRAVGQAEAMERIIAALNSSSYENRTKDYLMWAYIQALTDPNTKVKFVVIPANGAPVILDTSGMQ